MSEGRLAAARESATAMNCIKCPLYRSLGEFSHLAAEFKLQAQPNVVYSNTVEARKLEHSFRRISARIPYTLP